MGERCRRHFVVLMRKNCLLKRRAPISLLCELFFAVGCVSLLVLARILAKDATIPGIPAQHHVNMAMPVRLPECAEYVEDPCLAKPIGKTHGLCVAGLTYGCLPPEKPGDPPGIWTAARCGGKFDLGDGFSVSCYSGMRRNTCRGSPERLEQAGSSLPPDAHRGRKLEPGRHHGHGFGGGGASAFGGVLGSLLGDGERRARRYTASFAVAPQSTGLAFQRWLQRQGHPWADSVRLFDSAEAVQEHVTSRSYPRRDDATNRSSLLCGAVIFATEAEASDVEYTLRFNTSLLAGQGQPRLVKLLKAMGSIKTESLMDSQEHKKPGSVNMAGMTWYAQSGFLTMQRTVDDFIADSALRGEGAGFPAEGSSLDENFDPMLSGVTSLLREGSLGDGSSEKLHMASKLADMLIAADGRPHVVVPFPTPAVQVDIFRMIVPRVLGSFLLISMTYSMNRMITAVVAERERRLRDGMRLMGMHGASFHLSWFCTYGLIGVLVAAGVTVCLCKGLVLPKSSPSLLFTWLALFALACTSFGLAISTLFSKSKTSATVGSVLFYSSSYLMLLVTPGVKPLTRRLVMLLPPANFEVGAQLIADLESSAAGATWHSVWRPYSHYGTLLEMILILALDVVLFYALFLYLDKVMHREVGLRRPWYFPCAPSTWRSCCCRRSGARELPLPAVAPGGDGCDAAVGAAPQGESSVLLERELGEAAQAMARSGETVELRGLCKVYADGKKAVDSLDLVMYPGEVFTLLGHNGAGKTSTLSILCGLMPATRGSCVIFGRDLETQPDEAQKILGVCPQHDVLWEELTCEEHLSLFAAFKGVPARSVQEEVQRTLEHTGLRDAARVPAGHLSGGMKRRLSLGIALLGGSRLVVLDEPTSGLDPYARRSVWDLLRASKQGRVVVLSTHYMDEADILGDRVAILREGRLQCCGSPQFLKRAYSCGYNIVFVKRGTGCQTDAIMEAVCGHLPELSSEVIVLSDSAKEVVLRLPFAASAHFPVVLASFERQKDALGVESYGISVTTLEEVFLKVASGEAPVSSGQRGALGAQGRPGGAGGHRGGGGGANSPAGGYARMEDVDIEMSDIGEDGLAVAAGASGSMVASGAQASQSIGCKSGSAGKAGAQSSSGLRRLLAQTAFLFVKRARYGRRDRKSLLCQLFLPTLTLMLCIWLMSRRLFHQNPPLRLDVRDFNADCPADPKNVVDFSYLPSLHATELEDFLQKSTDIFDGEVRAHAPRAADAQDDPAAAAADEFLAKGLPSALAALRREAARTSSSSDSSADEEGWDEEEAFDEDDAEMSGVSADDAPKRRRRRRRLEDVLPAAVQSRLGSIFNDAWSLSALAAASSTATTDVIEGEARRLTTLQDPWHFALECATATSYERALWMQFGARSGMLSHDAFIKRGHELLRMYSAGRLPPGPQAEIVDRLALEAIFETLDQDGDGQLSANEFCAVGMFAKRMQRRYAGLAMEFSEQLLANESRTACPRYGAYFFLNAPRSPKRSKRDGWPSPSSADAVLFVNLSSSHTAPAFQAALTNARLLNSGIKKQVAVTVHPFPQTQDEQSSLEQFAVFLLAIYITFSLSFIPAGISNFIVRERSSGARQLQALSGASNVAYWLANLLYDMLLYIVPGSSVLLVLQQLGFGMLLAGESGAALACVLAAFGPAVIGFTYLASFLFKDHSKASNVIFTFCMVGAGILSAVLFVLVAINYDATAENPSACDWPTAEHPEGTCRSPAVRKAERIVGPLFRLVPTVSCYQALFSIALVADLHAWIPSEAMEAFSNLNGDGSNSSTDDGVLGGAAAAGASALGSGTSGMPKVSFSVWADEWAGTPLRYLVVEGIVYFLLAILVDAASRSPALHRRLDAAVCRRWLSSRWGAQRWRSNSVRDLQGSQLMSAEIGDSLVDPLAGGDGDDVASDADVDAGVEAERERLRFLAPEDTALHVLSLQKTYRRWLVPGSEKRAVRGVSFAVHGSEVFGLLGHNGAGKTSALKCIVGEHCCTAGGICVGGANLETETAQARAQLGYCPQFDALLELLTVQDHLELFAGLKGLDSEAAQEALDAFGLRAMAHRRADVLSGGNRRRLSAAIALLGNPRLAVLDEPSCGLDPSARRELWDAVQRAVGANGGGLGLVARGATAGDGSPSASPSLAGGPATAVLLTTHSMEEAEALSTRLGIMADGRLAAVGTVQQIKQRRSGTYELALTLEAQTPETLRDTLRRLGLSEEATAAADGATVARLLGTDPAKKRAYARNRCAVRAQIESHGLVATTVLAEWWLQQACGEAVESYLRGLAGDAVELVEDFGAFWRFRLPGGSAALPQLFGGLEAQKATLGIAEYTLTQATLEQIFNGMAESAAAARESTGANSAA
eukprot:TRINITY_DN22946_c0_g1_i1.p1 TRINITY_DN22946_c0_g1~~TRINITY_DN22946_c0_g1_i1.p1  ORF type:complete len:2360 (-),score=553.48 TRINITY_DN22946_c0_g1_i1:18-7097(-)